MGECKDCHRKSNLLVRGLCPLCRYGYGGGSRTEVREPKNPPKSRGVIIRT